MALALLAGGCPDADQAAQTTVRVGVLPDESEAVLRQRYEPLLRHLSEATGLAHALVVPENYGQLVEQFAEAEVDLAYFGGLTFIRVQATHGAVPLVMRDTDVGFRSHFLARTDNTSRTLGDFQGRRFAFGSKLSTSGHLMPRHFLATLAIDPEAFFSEVRYAGTHDRTAFWVRDGEVDLGAANAAIVDGLYRDGRLDAAEVWIVWTTPRYPDYVWATRRDLDREVREKILDAFLRLGPADAAQARILGAVDAGGFLPARTDDFDELRQIAQSLGML